MAAEKEAAAVLKAALCVQQALCEGGKRSLFGRDLPGCLRISSQPPATASCTRVFH